MEQVLKDRLSFTDNKSMPMPSTPSKGLWAKTEIMASYHDIETDKNGKSYFVKKVATGISALGETLFRTEKVEPMWSTTNMVPIGGCQFAMESLFGISANQIKIPTLYSNTGSSVNQIGLPDSITTTDTYDVPGGTKPVPYQYGNVVQLFGIGITDTAENNIIVPSVDYRENSIDINRVSNGLTLTGEMIPFRYTAESLREEDRKRYFGKKTSESGEVAYYLKRFEQDPTISHIWKSGEDVEDEHLVEPSEVWSNTTGTNVIESFTECKLQISKNDVKEWFIAKGQAEYARVNTIALFTGQYVKNADGSIGDYRDVRLFSKLHIPVEYLSLTKDLNLIYRVYTA